MKVLLSFFPSGPSALLSPPRVTDLSREREFLWETERVRSSSRKKTACMGGRVGGVGLPDVSVSDCGFSAFFLRENEKGKSR